MRPKEILGQARALLSPPQSWSQHSWAYDQTDARVPLQSKAACSWCLEGAIRRVAIRGKASEADLDRAFALIRDQIQVPGNYPTIQGWNDRPRTTHREVLFVLDKAIASA